MRKPLQVLAGGALFGAGLAISGMTDPSRVIGFLDVTGNWDPTLAFVMAGAVLVFGGGHALLKRRCDLPRGGSDPVSKRLIGGAVLFGVGWGLSGFCPGPALANLVRPSAEAAIFVPGLVLGMILVQRLVGVDAPKD